jgi:predicted SAM-dependent methyltransferase
MARPLMPKILIGIPTTRLGRWSREWDSAKSNITFELGSSYGWHYVFDKPIAEARNEICAAAIAGGYDYLVTISDDVLPPPNMVMKMLDKIGRTYPDEQGRPVRASMLTGVYWRKTSPSEPYIYRDLLKGSYRDWKAGEFFPVDFAGCDALMVEVSMLRELAAKDPDKPFFSTDWSWQEGDPSSPIATEDFWFYTFARLYGYRLFCDSGIQCFHEDRATGMLFGLTDDMPQAGGIPLLGDAELLVADIGAGKETRYLGPNVQVIRFDGRDAVKPDVRCDLMHIPEEWKGKFDVVYSSHVLEHFERRDTKELLEHWAALLKDGGKIILRVPNVENAFKVITTEPDGPNKQYAWQQIYGEQKPGQMDAHFNGFTPRKLEGALKLLGTLHDVTVVTEEEERNLRAEGIYHAPKPLPALSAMWEQIIEQEHLPASAPIEGMTPDLTDPTTVLYSTAWELLKDKTGRTMCDFCGGYGYYNPTGYSQEGCPKCFRNGYVLKPGLPKRSHKKKVSTPLPGVQPGSDPKVTVAWSA